MAFAFTKIVRRTVTLSSFMIVQGVTQLLGALSGLIILRSVSVDDYARYTLIVSLAAAAFMAVGPIKPRGMRSAMTIATTCVFTGRDCQFFHKLSNARSNSSNYKVPSSATSTRDTPKR